MSRPGNGGDGQLARNVERIGDAAHPGSISSSFEQSLLPKPMELRPESLDPIVVKMIPEEIARKYCIVAIRFNSESNRLAVATNDPGNLELTDRLPYEIGDVGIEPILALEKDILICLERFYSKAGNQMEVIVKANENPPPVGERPGELILPEGGVLPKVVGNEHLVGAILCGAIRERASDISIEPWEDGVVVRYRIDGCLRDIEPPCKSGWLLGMVSFLKSRAGMKIEECRHPQDGSIRVEYRNQSYDIRIATLLTQYGEMVTLRLLDPKNAQKTLGEMGLSDSDVEMLRLLIQKPNGAILATGPTGSGKTTLLCALLNELNTRDKKIITIEDPIEYRIKGINQTQTNERTGLNFSNSLRACLRQNPDVIMIGEMRDTETAGVALQAALTGHLVLSTLHTNDAPSAVSRLVDLGIPRFMIADALQVIIAQRLVRKLCEACSRVSRPNTEMVKHLGLEDGDYLQQVRGPVGCQSCYDGYQGVTPIHEILVCDEKIKTFIHAGHSTDAIKQLACEQGMKTLRQSGCLKAFAGTTSLDEVLRATIA